ncbi:MAG: hypothetical protein Q8S55_12565, partial [Methylococcaceae bacterium]|nr:hypothetical protein [Methylococcaceae bacterium]
APNTVNNLACVVFCSILFSGLKLINQNFEKQIGFNSYRPTVIFFGPRPLSIYAASQLKLDLVEVEETANDLSQIQIWKRLH